MSLNELFEKDNSIDVKQQIVEELLNENNLDRKTELDKPIRWACMTIIEEELNKTEMVSSAKILNDFTKIAFKYLISKNRSGRKEYIESLNAIASIDRQEKLSESANAKSLLGN